QETGRRNARPSRACTYVGTARWFQARMMCAACNWKALLIVGDGRHERGRGTVDADDDTIVRAITLSTATKITVAAPGGVSRWVEVSRLPLSHRNVARLQLE